MKQLRGKALRKYKEELRLSENQKALMIGSILGDGNLRIPGRNKEANFIIEHGEKQKDYLFWKYRIMKKWVLTLPNKVVRIYHKDRTRKMTSWRFLTIAHPEFTKFYRMFYHKEKKIVPQIIKKMLNNPLTLAVWIMDDGTKSGKSFFLNTQNFTPKEQERLIECLKENFGVEGKINIHSYWGDKILYRIRIKSTSLERLYKLVKSYILPKFRYKFPLYPRNDFTLKGKAIEILK